MRVARTFAAIALSGVIFAAVASTGSGDDRSSIRAAQSEDARHQVLGDWRLGQDARLRFSVRRGAAEGRALRSFRVGRCRVRRGSAVFRGFRFRERDGALDVWRGMVVLPAGGCRRRATRSRLEAASDARMTEVSRRGGRERERGLRRIRPRPRDGDPVLGEWERNGLGVVVRRAGRRYVGRARDSFLIANGCTIAAGEVIWRLRPLAPDRYDGTTRTFLPPPGCAEGDPARSRWHLSADGSKLARRSAGAEEVSYTRAGP